MSGPADAPSRPGRWSERGRRLRPVGGWVAGVTAGVVSALIATWLLTSKTSPPKNETPFTVAVRVAHGATNDGGWISGRPLSEVPARPGWGEDWSDWAARGGAVPHGPLEVDFTVQGRSEAQVTLTGLRVRVVARRPAVAGILFQAAGGDPSAFRSVRADLDQDPPTLDSRYDADFIPGNVPTVERKPIVFPYRVSISDAETLVVVALVKRCDCDFVIDLSWAAEGRTGTLTVSDSGHPFRVSGDANITTRCVTQGAGKREDCHPA
jgi:hypothetical protein